MKHVGDEVAVDEPLLEVSTDKVDTEIPSPVAGTLLEIKAEEDETVEVGAELAIIGSGDAGSGGSSEPQSAEAQPKDDANAEKKAEQEAEIRQMLEAKAYRQAERGEPVLDVEAEMTKLMAPQVSNLGADPALVEEVRQLVVARNERRMRKGEEPLDVEEEIKRQLKDLENL